MGDNLGLKKEIIGLMIDRSHLVTNIHNQVGLIIKLIFFLVGFMVLHGWAGSVFILVSWIIVDHVVKKLVKPAVDRIKEEANEILDI